MAISCDSTVTPESRKVSLLFHSMTMVLPSTHTLRGCPSIPLVIVRNRAYLSRNASMPTIGGVPGSIDSALGAYNAKHPSSSLAIVNSTMRLASSRTGSGRLAGAGALRGPAVRFAATRRAFGRAALFFLRALDCAPALLRAAFCVRAFFLPPAFFAITALLATLLTPFWRPGQAQGRESENSTKDRHGS